MVAALTERINVWPLCRIHPVTICLGLYVLSV